MRRLSFIRCGDVAGPADYGRQGGLTVTSIPLLTRRLFTLSAACSIALPAPVLAAGNEAVVVEIDNGKICGLRENGAIKFKGIPYAADTGGRNRFMAPQPVENWSGVRGALAYGDRCPQIRGRARDEEPSEIGYSENCCVLNVYAPDRATNVRRPVLVYFHGGGFSSGSGDSQGNEGSNLAVFGDLVVVTLNHRLNVFGYTPLGLIDPAFADAGNVGQLDLIAALDWVKRNIAVFGGDPAQITISGQSGGGSKVTALQVMPGATGLYRHTINMSGSSIFGMAEASERDAIVRDFLQRLGVAAGEVRKLQDVPAAKLLAAHNEAVAAVGAYDYRPVIDHRHIFHGPMSPEGLAMQAAVPGIISWTATEATAFISGGAERFEVTQAQVKARIAGQYGLDAAAVDDVWNGYHLDDPDRTPWQTLAAVGTDALCKTSMRKSAEARAAVGQQPVYVSEFTWPSRAQGGLLGSPHAMDIPFAFGNIGHDGNTEGSGPEAAEVSRNQMSIFAAFIRDGTPNNARIPRWTPYEKTHRETMVIAERCSLVSDYRSGDRRTADTLPVLDTAQVIAGPLFRG